MWEKCDLVMTLCVVAENFLAHQMAQAISNSIYKYTFWTSAKYLLQHAITCLCQWHCSSVDYIGVLLVA